ncbi:integrase [Ralstonia phage P-PSG-11-1]|uniref:Integrase n=1 Tax=Ralstonia phage P-PSG-11 TaxID=2652430 RepID=A0A5P8D3X3_9CAUD|nr:integrase [Ralstonia phage P-PSG-11]QFP93753.1 integrase [Ralstonia phage P-PSG-11-1]
MPVIKRGNKYQASVGSGADRWRKMFDTQEEAETAELEEKLRRKAAGKDEKGPTSSANGSRVQKTLKEAYERTLALIWKGTPAEKTHIINSNSVMNELGRDTPLTDITAEDVTEMILALEEKGNSGSTVNKKLSCLSMILKTAKKQWPGCIGDFPEWERRKEGSHRLRWINEAEEKRMLGAAEHLGLYDLRDYIIVGIDTGFRRGELLGFPLKDYQGGLMILHDGETKSGKGRAIPVTKRVHEIIQRRSNYSYLFQDYTVHKLRWQFDQLKLHMGLQEDTQFVVHTLRHTCASRMVQRGVPLKVVQEWMGHATITTTMRYAKLAPSSLLMAKKALEEEPAPLPFVPPVQTEMADLHDF